MVWSATTEIRSQPLRIHSTSDSREAKHSEKNIGEIKINQKLKNYKFGNQGRKHAYSKNDQTKLRIEKKTKRMIFLGKVKKHKNKVIFRLKASLRVLSFAPLKKSRWKSSFFCQKKTDFFNSSLSKHIFFWNIIFSNLFRD